ncbi:MAG: protein kinase [Nitrosomonas sp.]|uniref:ORC-CDC6 family AAA ATPase n=1 Tax=Nitrosomonas sp. TaxID=42353 RepID=UPI00272F1B49|nr:protein kinase [Nitrosomonas sp.]MDP1550039.1 protein kinase [Nitrosomonas sp.]
MPKELPPYKQFLETPVVDDGDFRLIEYIGHGCYALVFRGYSETLKQSAAYKIIPSENLAPGENWKIEPRKANSLEHPSVVHCRTYFDWREQKGIVVLKYDFVDGTSLHDFIKNNKSQITIPFIKLFLIEMLGLFYELEQRGIQHGDFHSRNILVTKPSRYRLNSTEEFKVTDFGIGGLTSGAELTDDYEQLARVLGQLLDCIDYDEISPEEKYAFNILSDHFKDKHLIEKDCTRDPLARKPALLLEYLEKTKADYEKIQLTSEGFSLLTPFDYLSCEQIGQQHSLLRALYSNKFLGISEIESVNNLVVTGPRGCGKSTVFRSLSINQQLHSEGNSRSLASTKYIGIYYHCNDLYFKFPRYAIPKNSKAIDLPLHYLTARLLIEIFDVLNKLVNSKTIETTKEIEVSNSLWEMLDLKRPSLPNADSFEVLISALAKSCQDIVVKYRTKDPIKRQLYGPDTLIVICEFLQQNIPVISGKPFFCFIDDYSIPHITEGLQQNLNRLLMQRNEFCFFKMATESPVSYAASDIDGKSYVEGREFEVLNLGLTYLREETARKLEFLDDVFKRRFNAVEDYPVSSLSELIGEGESISQNEIANRIADGEKNEWWGRKTFSSMCSGDIHQLITLARKMVSDSGGIDSLKVTEMIPKIQSSSQNKAIRTHAGDFLKSLADSGDNGEHLRQIVTAFGNVAHSYIKFKYSKNDGSRPRHQATRIELREAPIFEGKEKELYDDLIRYSIFIQDPRGKSFSGQLVPRLFLRRFLVPHFNLTFSGRDSLLMGINDFRELNSKSQSL